MMTEKIGEMLNAQIAKEFYSSYLYLAISNDYMEKGLEGFAHWFEIQQKEENDHAMLIRKYLQNDGIKVRLERIAAPNVSFVNFVDGLQVSLKHEKTITASINSIYAEAIALKDFKTVQFLDWFVKEQGEEEKNVNDIIIKFNLFAGDAKGLYMLNNELLARVYAAPSLII